MTLAKGQIRIYETLSSGEPNADIPVRRGEFNALCRLALRGMEADDPSLDVTDSPHPAWVRGRDWGVNYALDSVLLMLAGQSVTEGFGNCDWKYFSDQIARLLDAERIAGELAKSIEKVVTEVHSGDIISVQQAESARKGISAALAAYRKFTAPSSPSPD